MMSANSQSQPASRPYTSWAVISSNGSPQRQQQTRHDKWPAIAKQMGPQTDTTQTSTDILVSALESQLREVQSELEQEQANARKLVSEKEEAEIKVQKYEIHLDNAHKRLLSLQPPQNILDNHVKQAFDDLCQNIEDWVDLECDSLGSLEEILSANDWTDHEMKTSERHITEDDIKLSEELPNIRPNVIMNAIFSFVYECCLREDRWGAHAEKKEEMLLNGLVEVMSMRKPAFNTPSALEFRSGLKFTNNPQLRHWRSETYQALRNSKRHLNIRDIQLRTFTQHLRLMLKHFADKSHHIQQERLRSKIIEPAFALADMIKTATSGYKFDFVVSSSSPDTYLHAEDVSLHKLVDAQTGIEEKIAEKYEGNLGRLRLCVFPALQKEQDGGERFCLSKALVVLEKSSNMVGSLAAVNGAIGETNEKESTIDSVVALENGHALETK